MKRTILYIFTGLLIAIGVVGCGKTTETQDTIDGKITITCTSKKEKLDGIETQNVTTYQINDEQYATAY